MGLQRPTRARRQGEHPHSGYGQLQPAAGCKGGVTVTPEQIERISREVKDGIAIRNLAKRIGELDDNIADCHTRRKAAIMRAAQAVREV